MFYDGFGELPYPAGSDVELVVASFSGQTLAKILEQGEDPADDHGTNSPLEMRAIRHEMKLRKEAGK